MMAETKSEFILETVHVTKQFGGLTAVKDLSIQVPQKSIYSVIGPNGAGKTTFFNCITGFYKVTEGDIILDGESIVGLRPDVIVKKGIPAPTRTSACSRTCRRWKM